MVFAGYMQIPDSLRCRGNERCGDGLDGSEVLRGEDLWILDELEELWD